MSVTDELLRNNEHYAGSFTKGSLPLPRPREWPSSRAWTRGSISTISWGSTRATPT